MLQLILYNNVVVNLLAEKRVGTVIWRLSPVSFCDARFWNAERFHSASQPVFRKRLVTLYRMATQHCKVRLLKMVKSTSTTDAEDQRGKTSDFHVAGRANSQIYFRPKFIRTK